MTNKIQVKLIMELVEAGLSYNQISKTRHMSKHSIWEVVHAADALGITYQDLVKLDDAQAYKLIFPDKYATEDLYHDPDYEYIHKELSKTGVTLKLLWHEYRDKCIKEKTIAMGYTRFCRKYNNHIVINQLTNHLEHKPGDKIEVDWSGPTMSYIDYATGEEITVYLFVATLPYSQYSYVEPTLDMKMESFINCHIGMYNYFQGVATRLTSDNLKTGIVKHPKEGDIILTADYEALGEYYVTAIMPTQIRKPKQKASVEGTVGKVATAIIASLRNERFYSFAELNQSVQRKLEEFNHNPFEKREGTRYDAYLDEKEYLHPLPKIPYEFATWIYGRTVNLDFHVVFEKNRYSCPYQYARKLVDLKVTNTLVEIYYKGNRISTHNRFGINRKNQYSTHVEDMPEKFNITQWDDERIKTWAKNIGPNTNEVINKIFKSVLIKEQGYNPSLSILRLSKTYSNARLENACEYAIKQGIIKPRYHHLKAILSGNQDIIFAEAKNQNKPKENIGYLRGSEYYA